MISPGVESLEVVVADGERAFAESVVDSLEAVGEAVSADAVTSSDAMFKRVRDSGGSPEVDGVVIGDRLDAPLDNIERLAAERGPTIILLTGTPGDEATISAAVEAGIDDYFSRTTAASQCDLLVERIACERSEESGGSDEWDERQYEQIFNRINDTIAVFDPETGDIVDINETYLDVWGYDDLETIRELGIEGLSATEEGFTEERGREFIREVAETGTTQTVEWVGETKEGKRRWTEAKLTPVEIGGQERVVSIQRDITERRRTARRFAAIVERIDEAIYLSRVDEIAKPPLQPDDASAGFEEIWGQPLEDILQDYDEGLLGPIHPDDADECRALLEKINDDVHAGTVSGRYSIEFRIERPEGAIRWVEADLYPTEWETGPLRVVLVNRDITERKEREQRIASFHEATRELTAADSREMACRQAVTAAETVLGFPLVSTHLYDEGSGELSPVAATSRLEENTTDLPSFGPGESLPWQVFVEGESVTSSEPSTEIYGPGLSGPDIVLSLGTQGVMLVGAPEKSFDSEDIELAQVLAATLEAALNHVAGERALAEREQELRLQQERAERFKTLNTVIRDIEQATVDQSSRAGIEDAVCQRLTDIDVHELVWFAEPTVQEDELRVRTKAGEGDTYVDALRLDLDTGAGMHPAVSAYQNAETQVVENVATDRSGGRWRKTALRYGVQSVITVPVRYEGTVHGVLTVGSEEPATFDESTRDVFTELGRSIGYAISVAERERALESEGTVELEFAVGDEGLFAVRATDSADCRVSLERTIRRTGGDFSTFYVVEGIQPDEAVRIADTTPSIENAQVISEEDTTGLIEVTRPTWFGSVFTDYGAVLRRATAENGEATVVVEAPQGTDVRTLHERFQDQYPDVELVAQRQRERTNRSLFEIQDILQEELTERQWEAFQTAYSAGYFEWPREASGETVADLLDVTQPTFNKHLRLAEQKAVELLMERGYPNSGG